MVIGEVTTKLCLVRRNKRVPFMLVSSIQQEPPLRLGRRSLKSDNMQIHGQILDKALRVRKVGQSDWRATEFEILWQIGKTWNFKAYVIDLDSSGDAAMLTLRPASQLTVDGKSTEEIEREISQS
jgi:hypothetical protein